MPVCTSPVIDEVAKIVHEAVVSHYHNILRDFEGLDSANSGTVTAEAMRDVLTKHVMMLTDGQVSIVINPLNPSNRFVLCFLKSHHCRSQPHWIHSTSCVNNTAISEQMRKLFFLKLK